MCKHKCECTVNSVYCKQSMQSAGIVLALPKWREPACQAAFITFLKTSLNVWRFLQVSVARGWSVKLQEHHNTTYSLMRNSVTRVTYSGVTRPRAAMFAARSMPSLRLLCYPGGHRLQTGAISSRSREGGSDSISHRCPNDYQSSVLCSHKRENDEHTQNSLFPLTFHCHTALSTTQPPVVPLI